MLARTDWTATWTGFLVLIGLAQAGLFFWQLRLIAKSLVDTKTAADAAKRSADQTEASVTLARITAERQLRAYLGLEELNVNAEYSTRAARISRWTVSPVFKNSGATPAHLTYVGVNFELRNDDLPDDFAFADNVADTSPSVGTVGPGTKRSGEGAPVDRGMVLQMGMQGMRLFLWGHADYRDAFFPQSPERHTRFAAEVLIAPGTDVVDPSPAPFVFRMLDRYNDAD